MNPRHQELHKKYRPAQSTRPRSTTYNSTYPPKNQRWIENASIDLRLVGTVAAIAKREGFRLDHTGWYTDSSQSETVQGVVYQLPSRDSKPLYWAGSTDPCNDDCFLTEPGSLHTDLREAVRDADGQAERYAERAREDDTKFQAAQAIEDAQQEILNYRTQLRSLARELKANRSLPPTICSTLRSYIKGLREQSHKAHQLIVKLQANYWTAVSNY